MNLKIAIQKSGRLQEKTMKLLKECGIKLNSSPKQRLKAISTKFPAEVLFLRDDDIPAYVADGVADIGIVGENVYVEKQKDVEVVKKLGFSKCRLSLAIPRDVDYPGLDYFQGKEIATTYPIILKNFLKENNIEAGVHFISGSVEIAPSIGLAEGICDIVSTGSTLLSNGLKEVQTIMKSEAILVANKNLEQEKKQLLDKLLFRINGYLKAQDFKYILLNAPEDKVQEISSLIPGMKSPTILPLAEKGWVSVHSVINEDDFWDNIEKLQELGAEGILVVPIEKMVV